MTPLADRVRVARRVQRSVRIDTDLADPEALAGFVCPPSAAAVLDTMARHVSEAGQGAFTWTGPYGAGKSSLAVALAAALSGAEISAQTVTTLGVDTTAALRGALPPGEQGWRVLPVVGRRDRPARVVGEALERARFVRNGRAASWTDEDTLANLSQISKRAPTKHGGLLVLIDEMGKFLEAAAHDGADLYFFQQLAELASRSQGRLIVVGILHQAFGEYAHRLSREMRDEWAKIQGRFVDLTVSVGPGEQLDILGRAIEGPCPPPQHAGLAARIATLTGQPSAGALEASWPLHPVVACLLGPISRRRFGQNQRSVFGFLNSAEPLGFQDFIRTAGETDLYTSDLLWDYLQFNLEPSIMASPDGHRWALAVDAITRGEAAGADEFRLRMLKTVALVDLFRERSGLVASFDLLHATTSEPEERETAEALSDLQQSSLVIYRKFNDSYSVFAGSDFDIERAIDDAYSAAGALDHQRLTALAGFQPIIAKRHYHETGALRWFRFAVMAPEELVNAVVRYAPAHGAAGAFLLALPAEGDPPAEVERHVRDAVRAGDGYNPAIGVPQRAAWTVATLARDLLALEYVRDHTPALQGDRVARIEVEGRLVALEEQIERELQRALDGATWHVPDRAPASLDRAQLNGLASDLADARFPDAPRLRNELLNRLKPSSNAAAAQNALLRRMVLHETEERLGIDGFPAEGGLFASLLEATGLYVRRDNGWRFTAPGEAGSHRLAPAWAAARDLLSSNAHRTVAAPEIWQVWRAPPFGIKDGLMPILTAAFALSMRQQLAFYRDGIFQARLTDLDMQVLPRNPGDIHFRWMVLPEASRQLLSDLATVVREMDARNELTDLEPIDVARGLIAIYDRLPEWTRRTQRLSANARLVRQMFKRANDPNRLLFDDIPQALGDGGAIDAQGLRLAAKRIREGLHELQQAYPAVLHRLQESLLTELRVPNASAPMLEELRARAENVRGLGADHREEAFTVRVARFDGSNADMEGLAGLAVSKPPAGWTDTDVDHAAVVLADMAQGFVHREAFAHVQGRTDRRHAMAVVVGISGRDALFRREFDVTESERPAIDALAARMEAVLDGAGEHREHVVLAALAELSARHIGEE